MVTRCEAISNALLHRYSPTLFPLKDAARDHRGVMLMERIPGIRRKLTARIMRVERGRDGSTRDRDAGEDFT